MNAQPIASVFTQYLPQKVASAYTIASLDDY